MFKKEEEGTILNEKETETTIGPSVKVEGDFVGEGNVVVYGMVTGKLKTKKNLRVEPGAKIIANINAENALIAGKIQGNLKVKNKLELTNTAKITGDIETQILVIAEGAKFTGSCKMITEEERANKAKSGNNKEERAKK